MQLLPILNPQILWNLRRVIHPIIKCSDNVYLFSRDDGVSHGKTQWSFFPTREGRLFLIETGRMKMTMLVRCGVCVSAAMPESRNWVNMEPGEESQSGYVLHCFPHRN